MADAQAKLLVVDDDENNRDMLSRRLTRQGFDVHVADGGEKALELIERESYDLVLLDVMMPGLSGMDVLRQVRAKIPATLLPIIMATAKGETEDVVEALGLGANDYVVKPLNFPVVLARIETHLSHKRAVDRIVALERNLERRNADLESANARMRRELKMAAKLQHDLLPAGQPRKSGARFGWAYQPCEEIGGDILNIFDLGPGHVGVYLLDVSGHGVPAALLSVTLSRLLTPIPGQPSLVQRPDGDGLRPTPPAEVVAELNRRFPMTDSEQYFTIVYGVLDVNTKRFKYTTAGHPPVAFFPAGGAPRLIEQHAFAVGWVDEPGYEEVTVDLAGGDRLVIYSDGVTEACDPDGTQFGYHRMVQSLAGRATAEDAIQELLAALKRFCQNAAYADDVSVVSFEIHP